jgi:hypothetical protein
LAMATLRGPSAESSCALTSAHNPLPRSGGNQTRDLSGRNALISSEFYYFGRKAIHVPDRFRSPIPDA